MLDAFNLANRRIWGRSCVFRLIVDKVSRATWTRIPAAREQDYGVIVDGIGGSPESRSRCRAGMVNVNAATMME